jgi:hypothetical protein
MVATASGAKHLPMGLRGPNRSTISFGVYHHAAKFSQHKTPASEPDALLPGKNGTKAVAPDSERGDYDDGQGKKDDRPHTL